MEQLTDVSVKMIYNTRL